MGSAKMENGRKGAEPVEQWMAKDLEALRWAPCLGKRPGAQDRVSLGVKRQRTKGGAPFSAALKDKGSITLKVLHVNIYCEYNSNDCARR